MPIEGQARNGGSQSSVARSRGSVAKRGEAVARLTGIEVQKTKRGRDPPNRIDSLMSYLQGNNNGLYEQSKKLFDKNSSHTPRRSNGVQTPNTTPSRLHEIQAFCGLEQTPIKRHKPEANGASKPPVRLDALLKFIK